VSKEDTIDFLNTQQASARSALKMCKECIESTHYELLEKLKELELLNTLGKQLYKCALSRCKECISELERAQDSEEDLYKDCTRPTLRKTVESLKPHEVLVERKECVEV
jgi:hypothetical protein